MNTNFNVISLNVLGIKCKSTAPEPDALRPTTWPWPSELSMPAMPSSLHFSGLLQTKTKKRTNLCTVMGEIAFSYKPNPVAAQYLLMPVSRRFQCCLCRNYILPSTSNMLTRTDTSRQTAGVRLLPSPIIMDIRL